MAQVVEFRVAVVRFGGGGLAGIGDPGGLPVGSRGSGSAGVVLAQQPETNAPGAELMDRYAEVADWDLSTRKAHEIYIRRVTKPALGHLQVRKIRGPLLDLLYAQLRRCGDPGCTGKRFVEHRNVPTLSVVTPSCRPA